jgi:hypothetical protein
MAEFLLNNIPHHPKIMLRSSNCLNVRLPRHLLCKTCTTFLDDLVYNPKQKCRTSGCIFRRPPNANTTVARMTTSKSVQKKDPSPRCTKSKNSPGEHGNTPRHAAASSYGKAKGSCSKVERGLFGKVNSGKSRRVQRETNEATKHECH